MAITNWCRHQESNSGPTDYKSVALPTELKRHIHIHDGHNFSRRDHYVETIAVPSSAILDGV